MGINHQDGNYRRTGLIILWTVLVMGASIFGLRYFASNPKTPSLYSITRSDLMDLRVALTIYELEHESLPISGNSQMVSALRQKMLEGNHFYMEFPKDRMVKKNGRTLFMDHFGYPYIYIRRSEPDEPGNPFYVYSIGSDGKDGVTWSEPDENGDREPLEYGYEIVSW